MTLFSIFAEAVGPRDRWLADIHHHRRWQRNSAAVCHGWGYRQRDRRQRQQRRVWCTQFWVLGAGEQCAWFCGHHVDGTRPGPWRLRWCFLQHWNGTWWKVLHWTIYSKKINASIIMFYFLLNYVFKDSTNTCVNLCIKMLKLNIQIWSFIYTCICELWLTKIYI